jgi:hypothetical protein
MRHAHPSRLHRHRCAFTAHPFVSTTTPHICGSPTTSPRHRRAFVAYPFRLYDDHPFCLHDITAFLRYSPVRPRDHLLCLTDTTAHLRSTHFVSTDIAAHLWLTHFVSMTSPHRCAPLRYPISSTTTTHSSHRHHRAFAVLKLTPTSTGSSLRPPILSQRHHRAFAVHSFVSSTSLRICGSPISSHRHRRAIAVHHFVSTTTPLCLTDIAVHLRFTRFVSSTSPHPCGTPPRLYNDRHPFVSPTSPRICGPSIVSTTSLRPCSPPICLTDIAAHLRLTHFVSTTSPHPCDTLFRLYDHLHPLCLTDIAVHLRFTHCLTDTAHLRFILFGLYDFTPHHSTSTFYLSGISRTRGSVRLFVIALACPKVVRLYRTYLRIRTVV